MRQTDVPGTISPIEWLVGNVERGCKVGADPRLVSMQLWEKLEKRLKEEKDMNKIIDFKENIKKLRSDLETDSLHEIDVAIAKKN